MSMPAALLQIEASEQIVQRFAEAVIGLAHVLRLPVVAEGVENREQLELLSGKGCDRVQGYHFSRPVGLEKFMAQVGNQVFLKQE
ncbi:EAL domain-containing protein [Azovibrio restrictus]|uniref:EAL domain-containing protein n=1 Tax=Azovibrio restrictus TaxID=146938 RepID=UPI0026EBDD41|nr:EAL domain-containing protein [Azovibrio restrictus]